MLSIQKIESLIKPILEANNIGKFKISKKSGRTPILEICIKKQMEKLTWILVKLYLIRFQFIRST